MPVPAESEAGAEIPAIEIQASAVVEISAPIIPPEPEAVPVLPVDGAAEILPPAEEHFSAPLIEPLQISTSEVASVPDTVQEIAVQSGAMPSDQQAPDFSQPAAAPAKVHPSETSANIGGDPLCGLKIWRGRLGEPAIFRRYSRAMW